MAAKERQNSKFFDAIFSLRFILSAPFALILVISAGLIGYLGFRNGSDSAYDLTQDLISEASNRVQDRLNSYFAIPQLLIDQNLNAIRLGQLDLSNPSDLQQQFLAQLQSYTNIKGIVYGSEQREFVGTFRGLLGAEFVFAESTEETGYTLYGYTANAQWQPGDILYTRPDTDMRSRVWYQSAVNAGQSNWTPIYTLVDQLGIAVELVSPVYSENNELLGVMDISLDPSFISEFLREISQGEESQVFIIDEEGLLVASSTLLEPYAMIEGELQRFNTQNSDDPHIENASRRINDLFGAWASIENNQQFDFEIAGARQLAQISPYQLGNLNWWIIVSKPEATYMASINQHIQTTVTLITILLILSVTVMSLVSRWLTNPVIQLSQVAKSFASGNWAERTQIHRRDEIGQLGTAFNQMADELQSSVAVIQAREAQFRAIFENSSDAILLSQHGLQISGNPAYHEVFGYLPSESLAGKSILDIIALKERERIAQYVQLRSQGKAAPASYETLGLRQDGIEFDLEIHVSTFRQQSELYSLGIFRDISERKKAEKALVQSTELLQEQKNKLTERLKELNCLYQHSKLLEASHITVEELCQGTVVLIPAAWQYPEITFALISLEGQRYSSPDLHETTWHQVSPIVLDGTVIGKLIVYYLEEREMAYEGPFLKEERLLLDELAQRLAHKIRAIRADIALKQSYETLEQKVIERTKQLTVAKERVEAILNYNVDGILFILPDLTIQQSNPALDKLFASESNAYLGRSLKDLFDADLHAHRFSQIVSQLAKGLDLYTTIPAHRWDGTSFEAELGFGQIKDEGLVCVVRDITARKQAEDALRETLAKEKELGELKTRFVSMASHEFRTPLATILALSETLDAYRHKMEEPEIDECLSNIKAQVEQLKNIMEEVLLLAQMQARRHEFNPKKQNINAILRSIVYEFQNRSDIKHHLDYTSNQDNYEGLVDAKLIRQIVSNLLSNAIKYSPDDKPIEIHLEASPETCILSVRDYGIGIPEADLKHLFEPFHRASNVGIIQGTGLGLVITKESVELHGGTITVESHINVGTTFTVRVPVVTEKDPDNDKNTGDRR
jgi:PAS domain S-box-containing protein